MPRLMTTDEAAEFLQLAPYTLRRKARDGQIPVLRVGRLWRYEEATLRGVVGARVPTQHEQPSLFDKVAPAP